MICNIKNKMFSLRRETDIIHVAHKLGIDFDFPLFLAVHNSLFAYLDFVNQPEKRFPIKAFLIAVLPDKARPFRISIKSEIRRETAYFHAFGIVVECKKQNGKSEFNGEILCLVPCKNKPFWHC